jgi:hypothetical protein
MLRKRLRPAEKAFDRNALREHSEGGSKRFEEQPAGGNVADLER